MAAGPYRRASRTPPEIRTFGCRRDLVLLPAGERDSSGGYYQSRYARFESPLRTAGRVLLAVAALAIGASVLV